MSLAEKLVTLRKQNGLTQMELAEKLNVSRQAVSRWEVGVAIPGTDNLKVLGELYGVSIDYLLNDISDNIENQKNDVSDQTDPLAKKELQIRIWGALVFTMVVIITISIIAIVSRNAEEPTPVGKMDIVEEDNYSTDSFLIE